MRGIVLWSVVLVGCHPLKIGYPDSADEPVVEDPLEPCEGDAWPDKEVELSDSCTLPAAEMDLVELWSTAHPSLSGSFSLGAGRFEDSDGSGDIGPADAVFVLTVPYRLYNNDEGGPALLAGDGEVLLTASELGGAYGCSATIGQLDGTTPGVDAFLGWNYHQGGSEVGGLGEAGLAWQSSIEDSVGGWAWLLDLEADGTPEALWGGAVRDPFTGLPLLGFVGGDSVTGDVAIDLDLDGLPEIIGLTRGHDLVIWNASGQPIAAFDDLQFFETSAQIELAVGNLDDDPEGELVVATQDQISILDLDGSVLARAPSGSSMGSLVSLVELDGDADPEIVIDVNPQGATEPAGIVAFDEELSELWRWDSTSQYWLPFAVADLDADGLHELVVRDGDLLVILDHEGNELASIAAPGVGGWRNAPIIVDIDGDDLAEIVVTSGEGWAAAFENSTGGWAVRGADMPWPGLNHYPGDRQLDGSLPEPGDAHWLRPGENVWQGLAAGAPDLPDLAVEEVDRCRQDDGSTLHTMYLSNHGTGDLKEPVDIVVERDGYGWELARVQSPSFLAAGAATAVQIEIPATYDEAEKLVIVDADGRVAECGEHANSANWSAVGDTQGGE